MAHLSRRDFILLSSSVARLIAQGKPRAAGVALPQQQNSLTGRVCVTQSRYARIAAGVKDSNEAVRDQSSRPPICAAPFCGKEDVCLY